MPKTVSVTGYCPYIDDEITINATYTKYAVLGTEPLATFQHCNCPYIGECPDSKECPVALQKKYW